MLILRLCLLVALHAAIPAVASGPKTATFNVEGMACMLCEAKVKKALHQTPGVFEAKADRSSNQVEAKYDPDKVNPDVLAAVISKAGFKASIKR